MSKRGASDFLAMKVCRAWGRDREWLDDMSPEDRRDYISAYVAESLPPTEAKKMIGRFNVRKLRERHQRLINGDS